MKKIAAFLLVSILVYSTKTAHCQSFDRDSILAPQVTVGEKFGYRFKASDDFLFVMNEPSYSNTETGIYIYGKEEGNWVYQQKIIPDSGVFITSFDHKNDVLAIEIYNRIKLSEMVQFYEKDSSNLWNLKQSITLPRGGYSGVTLGKNIAVIRHWVPESIIYHDPYNYGYVIIYERDGNGIWQRKEKIWSHSDTLQSRIGRAVFVSNEEIALPGYGEIIFVKKNNSGKYAIHNKLNGIKGSCILRNSNSLAFQGDDIVISSSGCSTINYEGQLDFFHRFGNQWHAVAQFKRYRKKRGSLVNYVAMNGGYVIENASVYDCYPNGDNEPTCRDFLIYRQQPDFSWKEIDQILTASEQDNLNPARMGNQVHITINEPDPFLVNREVSNSAPIKLKPESVTFYMNHDNQDVVDQGEEIRGAGNILQYSKLFLTVEGDQTFELQPFPNPNNAGVYRLSGIFLGWKFDITDLQGKTIPFSTYQSEGALHIDISDCTNGMYLLRGSFENTTRYSKLIKY